MYFRPGWGHLSKPCAIAKRPLPFGRQACSIQVKKDDGTDKGNISYIYDATGNKLEKITEEQSTTAKSTYTTYLGGDVYENNVLKIISQEEGRVRRELIMEPACRQTGMDN